MTPQNIKIEIIRTAISGLIPEAEIFLFGSRARGDFYEDSDFDVLIVTKKEYPSNDKAKLKSRLRFELAKNGIPADLIINSEAEMDRNKELPGHVVNEACKEMIAI